MTLFKKSIFTRLNGDDMIWSAKTWGQHKYIHSLYENKHYQHATQWCKDYAMQLLDAVAYLTVPTCFVCFVVVFCLMLTSVCVKTSGSLLQTAWKLCWLKPFERSTAHERTECREEIIEGVLNRLRVDAHHTAEKHKIASGWIFDRLTIFGKRSVHLMSLLSSWKSCFSDAQKLENNLKGKNFAARFGRQPCLSHIFWFLFNRCLHLSPWSPCISWCIEGKMLNMRQYLVPEMWQKFNTSHTFCRDGPAAKEERPTSQTSSALL